MTSLAASRTAIYKDNAPFYGQTATAAEAVQLVRCALGLFDPPAWLSPLLNGEDTYGHEPVAQLIHDRVFVEVSSNKLYALEGMSINPMLLRRFFGGRPVLTNAILRYWGDSDADARWHSVRDDAELVGATEDELWIIRNLRVSLQSDDDIMLDIRRLHALVGDRMVLVPSMRAEPSGGDGAPPSNLQSVLHQAGSRLGIPVVDSGDAFARAQRDFGGDSVRLDDPEFLSLFEALLAEELRLDFLEPLRPTSGDPIDIAPARSRRVFGPRRRKAARSPSASDSDPVPHVHASIDYDRIIGEAAWVGAWPDVLAAGHAGGSPGPHRRQTFQAAWYTGNTDLALHLSRQGLAAAALGGAAALEGAELAFQQEDRPLAEACCCAAIRDGADLAETAVRLALAHGCNDIAGRLLDAASLPASRTLQLAALFPRDSAIRQRLANAFLDAWDGTWPEPAGEHVLLLALRYYAPAGGLDQARWVAQCCKAQPGRPVAAAGQAMLVRLLHAALQNPDTLSDPPQAEQIARELAGIEPGNARAVTMLARLLNQRQDFRTAAVLLEELAPAHPASVAIQIMTAHQWLQTDDLAMATAALLRSQALHDQSKTFAALKRRLLFLLERQRRGAPEPAAAAMTDLMARLAALPRSVHDEADRQGLRP